MSRLGTALAALVAAAGVGIIVLDQTDHRDLVRLGLVAVLGVMAIVGVAAYVQASEPDADRSAHRASQKELGRALRRGRLPEDPTHDEAIRRLAAEHRSRMASAYLRALGPGLALGTLAVVVGLARERPGSVLFGVGWLLLAVAMVPIQRRNVRRLDRLDAALDARRADDTQPA